MEEDYQSKYGVRGKVLYPSHAKDCPSFNVVPRTYSKETSSLIGAYAGNIFYGGYARLIANLAKCLESRGGRLLLFGPHSAESLAAMGLNAPNILRQGLVSSEELMRRLRDDADFVFVPMSFEADYNMRVSFPSKLTDYTATGLPIVVCGPDDCSAVRWAQSHAGFAEVVTSDSTCGLNRSLKRLERTEHRISLGTTAAQVGRHFFSQPAAVALLREALLLQHRY